MSTGYGSPCAKCQKAPLLRFTTDGNGRHREEVIQACPCERKKRGLCALCPKPVYGRVGRTAYCADCRAEKSRQQSLAWRHRNRERVREAQRKAKAAKYQADKQAGRDAHRERYAKNRERILALAKAKRRWSHPSYVKGLEARRKQKAIWRKKNREKLREYNREYRKRQRASERAHPEKDQFNRAA